MRSSIAWPFTGFPNRRSRPFRINVVITLQFVNAQTQLHPSIAQEAACSAFYHGRYVRRHGRGRDAGCPAPPAQIPQPALLAHWAPASSGAAEPLGRVRDGRIRKAQGAASAARGAPSGRPSPGLSGYVAPGRSQLPPSRWDVPPQAGAPMSRDAIVPECPWSICLTQMPVRRLTHAVVCATPS